MPTNLLLPNLSKTPAKQWLRVPLTVLVVLVVAFFAEIKWMQWSAPGRLLLFHQTPNGWQKLPAPAGSTESLRVSSGGTAWVLTWGRAGLSRWDGTAWQYYKETDFGTRTSFLDREFALDGEQVWTATEQGILHWDGQKWHTDHDVTAGFGTSIVAGGGEAWVIDATGKLSHFANGQWHSQKLALPGVTWSENRRYTGNPRLARTQDGAVWLMRQGLWRWDGASWTQVTAGEDKLESAELIGAAGDRVWLSESVGLRSVSLDGKHWAAYTNQQAGLGERVEVFEAASQGGRAWFGTSQGIAEFDGSNWRKLPLPDGGVAEILRVAAGPGGMLWIEGFLPRHSATLLRYLVFVTGLKPLAILVVVGWIGARFRKRQRQQHQLVTQAVQHATGEVPEELEAGAGSLKTRGVFGYAFLWIGTGVGYVLLRMVWPKAPYWTIAVIGVTIHLLMTFQESLVKRRPKPSDPIGPGAPSRYNWAKSWQAVTGALVLLALVNLDRVPTLRFLRGYWLWIIILVPTAYHMLALHLLHRAAKRGDYDDALNIIRWTNFYNPSGIEPLRMSGHMLVLAGRYREAEETLRRSLASSHARQSYGFALEYLGDALMEQGRYEEAMRSYEAALHAFPWRHRPYRGMAELLLRRGEKPAQALEYVENIVDFSGLSWWQRKGNGKLQDDYWGLKAWALARVGRTSEVAEAIENALKHTDKSAAPDMASTHYRAGMALQTLERESEANEHFNAAIKFDPHGRRGTLAKAALRETGVWGRVRV